MITIHFQYPICDIRKLLEKHEHLKPLPDWSLPIPNKQFLQYFGHVRRRKKGGHEYFTDELFFVEGKGGFKFKNLEKVRLTGIEEIKCIYRRIASDGYAGIRYEFGLSLLDYFDFGPFEESFYKAFNEFLKQLFTAVGITVKNYPVTRETNILEASKYLSALYEKATLADEATSAFGDAVKYGEIGILMEFDSDLFELPPRLTKTALAIDEEITLYHYKMFYGGKDQNIFLMGKGVEADRDALRSARISVMRLYFEHQTLAQVLSYAKNPNIEFDYDILDKYLLKKLRYFERKKKPDQLSAKVHDFIFSYHDLIAPGETKGLVQNLDRVRLQIKEKLWKKLEEDGLSNKDRFKKDSKMKIRELIVENKLNEAISVLEGFAKDADSVNELVLLRSRVEKLHSDERLGTIGFNQASITRNQLILNILGLVDQLI